jgi:hypothetical protein
MSIFYAELKQYLRLQCDKFSSLLSINAFRDDDFSYEQVFGHLERGVYAGLGGG